MKGKSELQSWNSRVEEAENLEQIKTLQEEGHHRHCACRQVWGDGECECDEIKNGFRYGECPDCCWYHDPKGCNVPRDSEICKLNKRPRKEENN